MEITSQLIQAIKTGSLFSRLTHEAVGEVSGGEAGFSLEETEVLVQHCNDPDKYDWFWDRFWKHFYDVGTGFGGVPQSCEYKYKLAVNDNNLVFLSHSSHYLMDVGCVFHTTFAGQWYHLGYEWWIDENIEEIISMINVEGIQPIFIDIVSSATIELAEKTNMRYYRIMEYLRQGNYDMLKTETADNLKDVIAYTWGLYIKFIDDVNNGVQYEVLAELGMNQLMLVTILISAPILAVYYSKPKEVKSYS